MCCCCDMLPEDEGPRPPRRPDLRGMPPAQRRAVGLVWYMERLLERVGLTDGTLQVYPAGGGDFGSNPTFALTADLLKVGTHTISLEVQDNDGEISAAAQRTLVILPEMVVGLYDGAVRTPIYTDEYAAGQVHE